tara:strand:+ start:1479 stop:5318 length:3840 start_codon:yes stop_codon:yes gene_type:complete
MPVTLENAYTPPLDTGLLNAPLDAPTFGQAFKSTFAYQYSPLLDRIEEESVFGNRSFDPDFDPFTQAAGYEEYLGQIARAKDQEHLDYIKRNIDERLFEKDVLTRAGITSGGVLIASLIDPLNIVFALPIFGQLGLLAKGGMTVRQAALASARGGFVTGVASEAIRAPFDKTVTDEEVASNILATTFFGGVIGSIPSVARAGYNYARKTQSMRNAQFQGRSSLKREIDGFTIERGDNNSRLPVSSKIKIEEGNTGKTVNGRYVPALYNSKTQTVKIDSEYIKSTFDKAPWTKPKVKGVKPLAKDAFKTPDEWVNFVRNHEIAHTMVRPSDLGINKKSPTGVADYENAINEIALKGNPQQPITTKNKKITIDDTQLSIEFDQRPWIRAEVKGATPLKETDFLTPDEWGEFQVMRSIVRSQNKRVKGESEAAYVDRTNKIALDRSRSGLELEETPLTRSLAWKMLTTPSKRILENGTNSMKVFVHRMVGVEHISTKNLSNGQATTQSVHQQAETHIGTYVTHVNVMRDLWAKDQLGRSKGAATRVFGYNTDNIVAKWRNSKTFEDWYSAVNEARLLKQAGQGFKKYDGTFSADFRQAMVEIDTFFEKFRDELEALNLITSVQPLKDRNARIQLDIEYMERMQSERGLTAGQAKRLESMRKQVEFNEGLIKNSITDNYTLPIYYDKAAIAADDNMRKRLVDIFEEHIKNNPVVSFWDDKAQKFIEVDPATRAEPRKIAEDAVASIMEEGDQMLVVEMSGIPKGKHLRHRQIAIPEYKIKDFIIKDMRVARSYAARVGKRIEFARKYGNQSIDDILDDAEFEMREKGFAEKKIVSLRADMAFEYERVMGEHIKDPSRFDNQTARLLKETAGISYLDAAALASVTDAGMLVMERGPMKMFMGARTELDRSLLGKNRKLIPATGEATELALGGVQQRIIADNIDGIEPTAVERVLNPITRAYYNIPILGNGLGTLTYIFKQIDGSFRASDLMDKVVRMANNTIDEADARYLLRYGISERDAKIMAQLPYEKGDHILHPNIDKWPNKTQADRELIRKWNTAMNAGIGNTVLHATAFDKPRIMDGTVYVRYRPWMKKIGFGESDIDQRASSKTIPLVRLESGLMTFPFQFYNFMLGATARVTGGLADPMRRHRITGAFALLGLGYLALNLKKDRWWFDARSDAEIFQRTVDQSGIFGVYGDIAYTATHVAIGTGLLDERDSILKPKYNPSFFDAISEPAGAAPGMVASWIKGATHYMNGEDTEAAREFKYNSPILPIFALATDFYDD